MLVPNLTPLMEAWPFGDDSAEERAEVKDDEEDEEDDGEEEPIEVMEAW